MASAWGRGRRWLLAVLVATLALQPARRRQPCPVLVGCRRGRQPLRLPPSALRSAVDADLDSQGGPSPEAWREFRAKLIAGGLPLTTDGDSSDTEDQNQDPQKEIRQRSVAKQNEDLLKSQNEELWHEYINGAWAHESPVEPGGLLCKRPLAAKIVKELRSGQKSFWGSRLKSRMQRDLPKAREGRTQEEIFESWSQNLNYCYRAAEGLVEEALEDLQESVMISGNPARLKPEDAEVIKSMKSEVDSWQAVCLVLSVPPGSTNTASEAVAINRPFSKGVDPRLAYLLLHGSKDEEPPQMTERIQRCAQAFEKSVVYVGGPKMQREPAMLVHGFEDLPGSEELAPGTRIYRGGIDAAMDGLLAGKYSPLDFRWFVGRYCGLTTGDDEWVSMACARPVALKQCLALPKPLWHEVMELCGGDNAAISRLELIKRTDLNETVVDETLEEP